MKILKGFVNVLFGFLFLWGASSFILRMVFVDFADTYDKELPLSSNTSIVVDHQNNVFIGLPFYEQVQVYDNNGKFITNWHVDSQGGTFYLNIENRKIVVYVERGDNKVIYNLDGTVLSNTPLEEIADSIWFRENSYKDSLGAKYWIDTNGFFPKVKKDEMVIINQSILLKSITFPNSLIISLISMIFLGINNRQKIFAIFKKYFNWS